MAERDFLYTFFSGNYQSSFSFDHIFQEGSERLHSKASLSKTGKAFRYQAFAYALQSECFEKNENTKFGFLLQ